MLDTLHFPNSGRGIIITLDSKNSDKLEAAITEIQELLPAQSVLKVERDVATLDG